MICQYCKAIVPDGEKFCSKCGQPITNTLNATDSTSNYWKAVDVLNDVNENERLEAIRKARAEVQAKTTSITRKVVIALSMVAVLAVVTFFMNKSSQEKLARVKADAIGNTYSDTSGGSVMFSGDKKDRIIVTIKNEHTLSYTRGNYTLHVSSKDGGGYSTSWEQNEIYETNDYEYTFSTSLFGNITLSFNGKTYVVKIDDDGTIYSINFYND